jgi:hypothetical protein
MYTILILGPRVRLMFGRERCNLLDHIRVIGNVVTVEDDALGVGIEKKRPRTGTLGASKVANYSYELAISYPVACRDLDITEVMRSLDIRHIRKQQAPSCRDCKTHSTVEWPTQNGPCFYRGK